jgi:hypothetical protein
MLEAARGLPDLLKAMEGILRRQRRFDPSR